jgi:phosphoribosylformylglycinamidine synthase
MLRIGVLRFPGINCEEETLRAAERIGARAHYIWHRDETLGGADVVIIPGGFSYGDYLRAGAIARFSPVMAAVQEHAAAGGPVLGICNGFQILCEAHLLPGALMRNHRLRYLSRPVRCIVEQTSTPFTSSYVHGQAIELPIAHGDGRYVADTDTLRMLEAEGRVVLRYFSDADNPNGAMSNIAGIMNAGGTVVGIMPHPERAADALVGNTDGAGFFTSIADWHALRQPVSHPS